mmetsp:Transcript_20506/g.56860  ORF Transcript_20506/g.56860 Transcript_20506/m.56860 type:complete len:214 (-) Transcript_20506:2170-2811(-)
MITFFWRSWHTLQRRSVRMSSTSPSSSLLAPAASSLRLSRSILPAASLSSSSARCRLRRSPSNLSPVSFANRCESVRYFCAASMSICFSAMIPSFSLTFLMASSSCVVISCTFWWVWASSSASFAAWPRRSASRACRASAFDSATVTLLSQFCFSSFRLAACWSSCRRSLCRLCVRASRSVICCSRAVFCACMSSYALPMTSISWMYASSSAF